MKSTLSLARVREYFRARKPKADDNIERSEPESILMNAQDYAFGILMTALWMMVAYAIMTDQLTAWIVNVLNTMSGPFEQRLAVLTAVFVAFSNALVVIGVAISREPSNGDIVDVVNDQSDEINERLQQSDDRILERLDTIERNM